MKKLFLLIVYLYFTMPIKANAQDVHTLDSLLKCSLSGVDTIKFDAYRELTLVYLSTDNSKALNYGLKAYVLAKKINSTLRIAKASNRLAVVYDVKGMPDSAICYYVNALKLFEEIDNKQGVASVYQNIGVMYYNINDYEKSMLNYKKALAIYTAINDYKNLGVIYINIGIILTEQQKYDESIVCYKKTFSLKQSEPKSVAAAYANIANSYKCKNNFVQAKAYNAQAIALYKKINDNRELAACYGALADICMDNNEKIAAKKYVDISIALAEKTNATNYVIIVCELGFKIDSSLGNYKQAAMYLRKAQLNKENLYKLESAQSINKLQVLYETEKKDKQITVLNIENEAKQQQRKQLLIILFLISVLLVVTIYLVISKQKANKLLHLKNNEIIAKTEIVKLQAKEIAMHQSQMNPHFIYNALNSLQGTIINEKVEASLTQLNALSKLMRITLNNSEHDFIPLNDEINYLQKYIDFELNRFTTKFNFTINIDPLIDTDNVAIPPMLLQPIIENSIKHAQLDKINNALITLDVSTTNDNLIIKISDNGCGRTTINTYDATPSKAMSIVAQRIAELHEHSTTSNTTNFVITDLKDSNNKSVGTLVQIIIPIHEIV
jgi:tetratricopeptide (TPR) repeat protein